jgi:ABC-2 type transport system ATP-binding protein
MRLILGLDNPTAGTVTVNGRPHAQLPSPMHEVGALLDAKAVHGGRSARNHLLCLAQTEGLPSRRVDELIGLVGLGMVARKRAGGFSLGMGQRLGIAAALLGNPSVLLLDEPVNGLDPEGVRWIRNLMKQQAAEGRTVFVSSHLMNEMAVTADHLIVIGRGRLLADCSAREFIDRHSAREVLVRTPDGGALADLIAAEGGQVTRDGDDALVVTRMTAPRIAELAARARLVVYELTPRRGSLEAAFLELTADSMEYADHGQAPAAEPAGAGTFGRADS